MPLDTTILANHTVGKWENAAQTQISSLPGSCSYSALAPPIGLAEVFAWSGGGGLDLMTLG